MGRRGPGSGRGGPGGGLGRGPGGLGGSGMGYGPGVLPGQPGFAPSGPGEAPGPLARLDAPTETGKLEKIPELVLYLSCGHEDKGGPGKVYQVDQNGRVLGIVNLPSTATGIALHRSNGLIVTMPQEGGKLMRIDDSGKKSLVREKDDLLPHPIDVGMAGESDTIVVADNRSNVLGATTTGGSKARIYQRFDGIEEMRQEMSVAVTKDRHVIFGTDEKPGVYRFAGDDYSASQKPILPESGGVAADPASLRWAATQSPNQIYVFEGEHLQKKLRLPPNKSIYRNGLLSFAPAGDVVVAARPRDQQIGETWLLQYDTRKDEIRSLFPWEKEPIVDFVVGPRMYWERHSPSTYRSLY